MDKADPVWKDAVVIETPVPASEFLPRFGGEMMDFDLPLRTYDKYGQPVCPCGERTNAAYRDHPVLTCWSCGRLLGAVNEREATVIIATLNTVRDLQRHGRGLEFLMTGRYAKPTVHYAPYGPNAIGGFDCGAKSNPATDQFTCNPSYVTCEGCKLASPGLWPERPADEPLTVPKPV